ncbi:MAG: flagellin FliC [Magnetococcales bacterium]|nr:flagellin FliC [Magnetococcales bacterium]MBF0323044.1 flagellin FliC [Magnetococcales bacterium]
MGLSINTNINSVIAQKNLGLASSKLSKSYQRLSSGLRVNNASDDAAGLGIASSLMGQIRGANMASRNVNDALSVLQVADGALDETVNSLQRMRELAVQASNGVLTSTDRDNLNTEFQQLMSEVNRIAGGAKFNGQTLLMGSLTAFQVQVGQYSGQILSITVNCALAASIIGTGSLGGAGGSAAYSAITQLDYAITSVANIRATIGALQNRFDSVVSTLGNIAVTTDAARSRIMDADIATETALLTRNSILQQAATSVLVQANQSPQVAMALLNGR